MFEEVKIVLNGKYVVEEKHTIVDKEDLAMILSICEKWHLRKDGYVGGCYLNNGKWKTMLLHRVIMGVYKNKYDSEKNQIDHINQNKLDNRKDNLKICTTSENRINRGISSKNKTGYKGIYFDSTHKMFKVKIVRDGKLISPTNYFNTIEEAIEVKYTCLKQYETKTLPKKRGLRITNKTGHKYVSISNRGGFRIRMRSGEGKDRKELPVCNKNFKTLQEAIEARNIVLKSLNKKIPD